MRSASGWLSILLLLLAAVGCDSDEESEAASDTATSTADGTSSGDVAADGATTSSDAATSSDGSATASDTAGADATSEDTAASDTSEPVDTTPTDGATDTTQPPEGVPMFVAVGHMGRTVVSCDDGRTWVADRSIDTEGDPQLCGSTEPVVCWGDTACQQIGGDGTCETTDTNCDCDHNPGAAQGVAWGDGHFVATWGWGPPGSVRTSADGVSWTRVVEDTTFGGIAYGNDTFLAGDRSPMVSSDGTTWTDGGPADLQAPNDGGTVWNVRVVGFADVAGGRFVITGESGDKRDILLSADAGATWFRPDTLPPECSTGVRGVTGGNGVLAIVHRNGLVCRSTDGGTTFVTAQVGADVSTNVLFDGERFLTWGGGNRYESTDAETWTATESSGVNPGPVAYRADTGTFVTVNGGWNQWYENQSFYWSTDGITWTEADAFTGGHPIRDITFGWGAPSAACPDE